MAKRLENMRAILASLRSRLGNSRVGKEGPEMEKPAAGGGAAGFPIEPNDDWEEECRHSRSRPWEEE